ncbi:MAG: hypothetical protein CVU46_11995 [Chloroflexi bacterium HGW-Chloroflexi-8]|nr:MAG: hypothetical protein CVU46_11995 [Chloroflexi bacterium HGW-Chloroflexi-8]
MHQNFPKEDIEKDLALAYFFNAKGEFGKSRVCARKAAGKAARFWLRTNYTEISFSIDPFQALKLIQEKFDQNDPISIHIRNLLLKVDKEFNLPENIDLLKSSEFIITNLFEGDYKLNE